MPFIRSIRKNRKAPAASETGAAKYFDITGGDEVYTAGGYTIHTFTTVGESALIVKPKAQYANVMHLVDNLDLEYVVIAGGGEGGSESNDGGSTGGGGAGGYRTGSLADQTTIGQTYPVSIGAGGDAGPRDRKSVV
jgi:hypothetical protein